MTVGEPWRHPDTDRWMVPIRLESEVGGDVGFGWAELDPTHPQYAEWREHIKGLPEAMRTPG